MNTRARTALMALAMVCLIVAGCDTNEAVPTQASIEMALTAAFMTANAPPPGFTARVQFAPIDRNLEALPHWHYTVSLSFNGVYADTGEATDGTISAEVYSNEVVGERRVILTASGGAFGPTADRNVEGVRIGNAFYFVDQNGVCSTVTDDPGRRRVAELTAGSLIGGVRQATHTITNREVNGAQAWQFAFLPGDVDPPVLEMTQGGTVRIASGELWIAPALNAVVEYTITFEVSSVILPVFQGDRQLSGTLRASYRLVETLVPYNIAIPFGC